MKSLRSAELVKDMRQRRGGYAADAGRQSGVRRAGRSEFSGCAEEGEASRARGVVCRMRPRHGATGMFRRRIIWNRGAMRGPMTARLSIVQPLIAPIYDGKTLHEVMNVLASASRPVRRTKRCAPTGRRSIRVRISTISGRSRCMTAWSRERRSPRTTRPRPRFRRAAPRPAAALKSSSGPIRRWATARCRTTRWLQEMPKPQNKMTWDNAVWISPDERGDTTGSRPATWSRCDSGGRKVEGPVWIMPGHADESITVHFGYGRTRAGKVGERHRLQRLRAARDRLRSGIGAGVEITRKVARLSRSPPRSTRRPWRSAIRSAWARSPSIISDPHSRGRRRPACPDDHTMFPLWDIQQRHKWGMSIDLTACVGCQACMVACQAENNIAVVGKEEVAKGRHMHWIRVDRYYHGHAGRSARCIFSRCRACIAKTRCASWCVRSRPRCTAAKGLNEMVYNRCVGTRYCSNNCPYKVRRFNFFLYSDWDTQSLCGVRNPDVTVRSRGVMEKCSYCVQRINRAKIDAEKAGPAGRGWRDCHGVPAGLPGRGDRVRRFERSQQPRGEAEDAAARLRAAGGLGHASAHHLSGAAAQSESGSGEGVRPTVEPEDQESTAVATIDPGPDQGPRAGARFRHRHRQDRRRGLPAVPEDAAADVHRLRDARSCW